MSPILDFATDPVPTDNLAQVAQSMAAAGSRMQAWLLIDAALVEPNRLASAIHRSGWQAVNALESTPLAGYGARAPQLVQVFGDSNVISANVRRINLISPDAPALSWIFSEKSVDQIQACAGYLAQAEHDGLRLHCRIADTRVLPALLSSLSGAQSRRVGQCVSQWHWLCRDGSIDSWCAPVAGEGEGVDQRDHIELDSGQFASLLDVAEADAIFAQLLETVSQLVPRHNRSLFHARLQRQLHAATRLNVFGNSDRLQFVVLSLTCGDQFHQHPDLAKTWQAVTKGASLVDQMKGWTTVIWDALEWRSPSMNSGASNRET